jgi:hypothetical protein
VPDSGKTCVGAVFLAGFDNRDAFKTGHCEGSLWLDNGVFWHVAQDLEMQAKKSPAITPGNTGGSLFNPADSLSAIRVLVVLA